MSESYKIQGVIQKIMPTERVSDKFQKRSIWLRTEGQYAQIIEFQLTQARCDLADSYAEGMEVIMHFDLQGRIWDNPQKGEQVFNTLNCWKIERVGGIAQSPQQPVQQPTRNAATEVAAFPDLPSADSTGDLEGGNDLPF